MKDTLVYIEANGETIETTKEHPFWVEGQGWKKAKFLNAGDMLRDASGNSIEIDAVDITSLSRNQFTIVYNLEIAEFHTYYVSESAILVHNKCVLEMTDDELIDAANQINKAQYGNSFFGKKNPITVSATQNGNVVISKNNGIPGRRSRAKAIEIFGNKVEFAGGRAANFDVNRWGINVPKPNHAEARGIQYMLSHDMELNGARQATSLRSCRSCLNLQKIYGINNVSG